MSPNRVERHKYKSNILFCILFFFIQRIATLIL